MQASISEPGELKGATASVQAPARELRGLRGVGPFRVSQPRLTARGVTNMGTNKTERVWPPVNDAIEVLVHSAFVVRESERGILLTPEVRALEAIGTQVLRELNNRADLIRELTDRLDRAEGELRDLAVIAEGEA